MCEFKQLDSESDQLGKKQQFIARQVIVQTQLNR